MYKKICAIIADFPQIYTAFIHTYIMLSCHFYFSSSTRNAISEEGAVQSMVSFKFLFHSFANVSSASDNDNVDHMFGYTIFHRGAAYGTVSFLPIPRYKPANLIGCLNVWSINRFQI